MRAKLDADVVVLGGGCAGLSLGAQLARLGPDAPRTLIIEPRDTYSNDRTWSGWRQRPHLFEPCVSHSWDRWRVAAGGRTVERGDKAARYETIPADAFYARAQRLIGAAQHLSLRTGVTAGATGADTESAWVETSHGRLRAGLIVDTRPPPPEPGAGLLQLFTGIEVETEAPCFDPAVADLMLFDPPSDQHVSFVYGLPFSPRHALIELTHFTPGHAPLPTRAHVLARIAARVSGRFTIRRVESGVLAMCPGLPAPLRHPRLLTLGTLGGAARPATGYAFANIQLQAEALAGCLRHGVPAALGWRPPMLPHWLRAMDRLFLRVLRLHPERGPHLLFDLFDRCPAPALIRFLSGTGSPLDAARVACALPKLDFATGLLGGATAVPQRGDATAWLGATA
jgi:lycopene beta-cyclase